MDGFLAGVKQYNKDNSTNVEVLGWDGTTGLFTGDFDDQDKGKNTTKSLRRRGRRHHHAGGRTGRPGHARRPQGGQQPRPLGHLGRHRRLRPRCPTTASYFLTTVEKKIDNAVFDAIQSALDDELRGRSLRRARSRTTASTSPTFHEFDSKVPQELKDKVEEYQQKIIDGSQSVEPT